MSGAELAEVVSTLPMADQQMIRAMVHEIVSDKLDEVEMPA